MGPMTGRRAGYCAGYGAPGFANPMPGWGMGLGWGGRGGGRRGWRHVYHATGLPGWARYGYAPAWGAPPYPPQVPEDQEVAWLKQQAEWLQGELEAINQRLEELEK